MTSVTNKIMKRCLSDELATTYNFCGHRNKKAFNTLLLRNVVVSKYLGKVSPFLERLW